MRRALQEPVRRGEGEAGEAHGGRAASRVHARRGEDAVDERKSWVRFEARREPKEARPGPRVWAGQTRARLEPGPKLNPERAGAAEHGDPPPFRRGRGHHRAAGHIGGLCIRHGASRRDVADARRTVGRGCRRGGDGDLAGGGDRRGRDGARAFPRHACEETFVVRTRARARNGKGEGEGEARGASDGARDRGAAGGAEARGGEARGRASREGEGGAREGRGAVRGAPRRAHRRARGEAARGRAGARAEVRGAGEGARRGAGRGGDGLRRRGGV